MLARQRILGLEPRRGADGIERCAMRLDADVVRTHPQPRRPFQGWRYLRSEDAPRDLMSRGDADLPPVLAAGLGLVGVSQMRRVPAAVLAAALGTAAPAAADYNWNELAAEFCRLTLTGDLPALRPLISDGSPPTSPPPAPTPRCRPPACCSRPTPTRCRSGAHAQRRDRRGPPQQRRGGGAAWTEYLVIVPERDGTTRIDDVLFATRRSDTLRARLYSYAGR